MADTKAAREAVERLLRIDRRTFTLKAGDEQIILAALAEADEIKAEFAACVRALRRVMQYAHHCDKHDLNGFSEFGGPDDLAAGVAALAQPHARVVAQEEGSDADRG